jgi:2-isopropylmalate synthase
MENHESLLFNWNKDEKIDFKNVELHDETLREGVQACGIVMPTKHQKYLILEKMCNLPITSACIGFPASSKMIFNDVDYIIKSIVKNENKIQISCCARSTIKDITPIVKLSQKYGIEIEANIFLASSSIRHFVENWDIKDLIKKVTESVKYAIKHNLKVCFITEDTTRADPQNLKLLYVPAIREGAQRICLCDTVGFITPSGVHDLVRYIKKTLLNKNQHVKIDWHSHNDLGLSLCNSLAAIKAGVHRIHATGLGLGERAGNTSMEQLIANISIYNRFKSVNPVKIIEYCDTIAKYFHFKIPKNSPIVGKNTFSTGAGVHASAIIKARKFPNKWLMNNIFSSLPANEFGCKQTLEINHQIGISAIKYFLEENKIYDDGLLSKILEYVKRKRSALTKNDINALLSSHGYNISIDDFIKSCKYQNNKIRNYNIEYSL